MRDLLVSQWNSRVRVSRQMSAIPKWNEVLSTMSEDEKKDFLKWWTGLPPFSFQFDMQAIVALAYQAGLTNGRSK